MYCRSCRRDDQRSAGCWELVDLIELTPPFRESPSGWVEPIVGVYEVMGPVGFEVALTWPLALVMVTSEKTYLPTSEDWRV